MSNFKKHLHNYAQKELELLVCNSRNIIFHGPIVGIDKFNKKYGL